MITKIQYALVISVSLVCFNSFAEQVPVEDLGQPAQLERPSYYDDGSRDGQRENRQENTRAISEYNSTRNRASQDGYEPEQQERPQLNFSQRINRLERQIQNIYRDNLSDKIEQLQDQLQSLRGQIEKQQHDIQVLAQQQKQFYSDLNSRLSTQQKANAEKVQQLPVTVNETLPETTTALTAKESQAYQDAFELLKNKQYDDSITAFQKYLMQYPDGHYVVNSNYWLGEVYYLQGKPSEAKKAFMVVVTNFPHSQKMPDAMLKLAIIAIDAGDMNHGRELLSQVQQQYPGTTAARLAALRAQELKLSS